jgi:hypothetical protein
MRFAVCPACGTGYPEFTSPEGTAETFCGRCGWCSDYTQYERDMTVRGAKRVSRAGSDRIIDE